jgi:hypothetical protein
MVAPAWHAYMVNAWDLLRGERSVRRVGAEPMVCLCEGGSASCVAHRAVSALTPRRMKEKPPWLRRNGAAPRSCWSQRTGSSTTLCSPSLYCCAQPSGCCCTWRGSRCAGRCGSCEAAERPWAPACQPHARAPRAAPAWRAGGHAHGRLGTGGYDANTAHLPDARSASARASTSLAASASSS